MSTASPTRTSNSLGQASSAYLRSAQHQPIAWNEWGPDAFAKARRENKPILLDIGAVWCHWCHVMDRESYEDPRTAEIINANFIAIKVDRDERPDVDTRYQSAISAISGQGGWPLTAFLTPDGKPFFGGTYFPPEERFGRPSFQRVLLAMADAFANRPSEVEETAGSVMAAIEHNETFSGRDGDPGAPLLGKMIQSILSQFDERNGGFGSQPKFPHSSALDLLLDAAGRHGPADLEQAAQARRVASITLQKMAAGGIYDQLAGGFHRYSVDERWIVPHFEKMAYDNSELLKNYTHAAQTFGESPEGSHFASIAKDILRWMDEWLLDRQLGGFFASQDADDSLDDDGDYFTWTLAEARAVLTAEEYAVAEKYYNLREVGDMHHNPAKNVLHLADSIGVSLFGLAAKLGKSEDAIMTLLSTAKQKLHTARLQRKMPYVDKTIYTGWNGMCISAYFAAGRALNLLEPIAFALKSLDRILSVAWNPGSDLAHVVAYGEASYTAEGSNASHTRIPGVLEDYAFLANASLDAWETTGEPRYFTAAKDLADAMLTRFYDVTGGGFFDTETDPAALGALAARRKPLQDAPTPAGNAIATTVLLRLHALTGDPIYDTRARETLETFAGIVEHFGLFAASYGLALRRAIEPPVQVCILGSGSLADDLAAAATSPYAVEKSIVRLTAVQLTTLPPALAETLPHLPSAGGSVAVVCQGNACLPPFTDPTALRGALEGAKAVR